MIGIRAEHIEVSTQREGALAAIVEVVEPTGAAVLVTARMDGQPLKVQAPPGFVAEPDRAVWLRLQPAALRFYDPETALALAVGG